MTNPKKKIPFHDVAKRYGVGEAAVRAWRRNGFPEPVRFVSGCTGMWKIWSVGTASSHSPKKKKLRNSLRGGIAELS